MNERGSWKQNTHLLKLFKMERVFYDEATQFFIFFPIYMSFFLSAS